MFEFSNKCFNPIREKFNNIQVLNQKKFITVLNKF